MAENVSRTTALININIEEIYHLRGSKGEAGMATIKVDYNEKSLGDLSKFEFHPDNPSVAVTHSAHITCITDDVAQLDDLAHKPVILTVFEVLPKEKKQKEEKVLLLGQISLDLFPLLKGQTDLEYALPICPTPGSPLENLASDIKPPIIVTRITVSEPLLDEISNSEFNLCRVTVESCFSPPDTWTHHGNYIYTAYLPIPLNSEKEVPLIFTNGQYKLSTDKDIATMKQKRWPNPCGAQGRAVYIPNSRLREPNLETEDGDYRSKDDREHRMISEVEKNRVIWNMERRCYMNPQGVTSFQEKIAKYRYWPVEVFRSLVAQPGKGKAKDDDVSLSFHGVAYLNLAPLLYPGVKQIYGAYKVEPYIEQDMFTKTGHKGMSEEVVKLASNIVTRSTTSPYPKKTGGKEPLPEKVKESKKGRTSTLPFEEPPKGDISGELETVIPHNIEGQQYADCKSYLTVEVELLKPLIKKRSPNEIVSQIADRIPARPLFPKRTDGAQRAVEDYHVQIANVANLVLDEFRKMFETEILTESTITTEKTERRRHKLLYELNSSGKYFAFKEQLKHSIIKIVREKFLHTSKFSDPNELQAFLSELYVYLVDEMHVSLNRVLVTEDEPIIELPVMDSVQLKQFAVEAEINQDLPLASRYHQERIAKFASDVNAWFDYGVFCMYQNNLTKAHECFKEAISLDQKHVDSILLYGIICCLLEDYATAETFFEAATSFAPKNLVTWTLRGLFYDTIPNEIFAEMAYQEAHRINQQEAKQLCKDEMSDPQISQVQSLSHDLPFIVQRETKLADQGGLAGNVPETSIKSSVASTKGVSADAGRKESYGKVLDEKQSTFSRKGDARGSTAHSYRASLKALANAQQYSVYDEHRDPSPVPTLTIYLRSIEWLLKHKAITFSEKCLAHELLALRGGVSYKYYVSYGHLMLLKGAYNEAEEALNEAIKIDFKDPDSWALIGHINFFKGDYTTACQCYERTLMFESCPTDPHPIYTRLAHIYLEDHQFVKAKPMYLKACESHPSCMTWLGVGIACYRLNELVEAEDALSEANIYNNLNAEVWAYLSLVCLKTERRLEAEQAYKYTVKLNLDNDLLMSEIHDLQKQVGYGNPQF